jgi:hypothetical protein
MPDKSGGSEAVVTAVQSDLQDDDGRFEQSIATVEYRALTILNRLGTVITPLPTAYLVGQALYLKFSIPLGICIFIGIAIELTGFASGSQWVNNREENRRTLLAALKGKTDEQREKVKKHWKPPASETMMFVAYLCYIAVTEAALILFEDWRLFPLPLLSLINTLVANDRLSSHARRVSEQTERHERERTRFTERMEKRRLEQQLELERERLQFERERLAAEAERAERERERTPERVNAFSNGSNGRTVGSNGVRRELSPQILAEYDCRRSHLTGQKPSVRQAAADLGFSQSTISKVRNSAGYTTAYVQAEQAQAAGADDKVVQVDFQSAANAN